MQKTISGLAVVAYMTCCTLANASFISRVTAVASPAWIQQAENKTSLEFDSALIAGDRVVTGENGRIEARLWTEVRMRVYPGSEIRIMNSPGSSGNTPLLKLNRGRICLESPPASRSGNNFRLDVSDLLMVTIQQYGHICASRREGMSIIMLRAGSVQINNMVDPGIVILSEAGIEFHMDDEGAYRLQPTADAAEIADMRQQPFITELETAQPADDKSEDTDEASTAETETPVPALTAIEQPGSGVSDIDKPSADTGGYVYTVYLFSTRSEETADRVNKKFRQAGHDTRILVRENENPVRYRIAVSGFESWQSANEFSDSIVGNLGIKDTWIGKDEPAPASSQADQVVPEANTEEQKSPQAGITTQAQASDEETEPDKSDEGSTASANDFIYTVYLFSTTSEETANRVNEKFKRAGHDTRILVRENENPIRYRIAVTGFESWQSASEFADSIVGSLGIKDSWIGKDRASAKD